MKRILFLCFILLGTFFSPIFAQAETEYLNKIIDEQVESQKELLLEKAALFSSLLRDIDEKPDYNDKQLKKLFRKMHQLYLQVFRNTLVNIPRKAENDFSESFFKEFFLPSDKIPQLEQKAQKILNRLIKVAKNSQMKIIARTLSDSGIMAFSKAGNIIVFSSGSVKLAGDLFPALVAHELAHLDKRDYLKGMIATRINKFYLKKIGNSAKVKQIFRLVLYRFKRFQEFEADGVGVKYLKKAGYLPESLVYLIEKLKTSGSGTFNPATSDHPSPEDRIKAIKKLLD